MTDNFSRDVGGGGGGWGVWGGVVGGGAFGVCGVFFVVLFLGLLVGGVFFWGVGWGFGAPPPPPTCIYKHTPNNH